MHPQARFNLIALLISLFLLAVPASAVNSPMAGKTSRTSALEATVTGRLLFSTSGGLPFVIPTDAGYLADVPGYQSTATVTVTGYDDGGVSRPLPGGATVLWSVKSVSNPSAAWWLRAATAKN
ncbi:MAG: hypothetical protein LBP33_12895, partial [Candidatus Adiutrix sp.]|nr:hypothetical protein [Candidatus Adiutrix sp.]